MPLPPPVDILSFIGKDTCNFHLKYRRMFDYKILLLKYIKLKGHNLIKILSLNLLPLIVTSRLPLTVMSRLPFHDLSVKGRK